MEYMAGCYRQREGSGSLLLQHYICGGVPVFLGCVCGGDDPGAGMAGGIFTGRLLGEFRSFRLGRAVKRPEKYLEKMEEAVYRHRESSFLRDGFYAVGILCIGEVFLSFSQDGAKIILCNTGFGRPVLSEIGAEDGTGLHFWRGIGDRHFAGTGRLLQEYSHGGYGALPGREGHPGFRAGPKEGTGAWLHGGETRRQEYGGIAFGGQVA